MNDERGTMKGDGGTAGCAPGRTTPGVLAAFCHEEPDSAVGSYLLHAAASLAARGVQVHVFCRSRLGAGEAGPNVHMHELGDGAGPDLIARAGGFAAKAREAFARQFGDQGANVPLLACEWSAAPVIAALRGSGPAARPAILSVHSLEPQRADLTSEVSQTIVEKEKEGLRACSTLLVHGAETGSMAKKLAPECAERLVYANDPFPVHEFEIDRDAGEIKARAEVGPTDPMVLFIGDLEERHGPDIVMKSVGCVLRNHPQARFVFVGEGWMQWPLRVHARYCLHQHAVRLVGHVGGLALRELIHAAEILAVPSRERTEDWEIQAGWSAGRAVMATHVAGDGLVTHDKDGLLIYPHESSCVWGLERLLRDHTFREMLGANGKARVREYSRERVAGQLEYLIGKLGTVTKGDCP
jgi:glycosyltransferase involved in cell wall biosynthesis